MNYHVPRTVTVVVLFASGVPNRVNITENGQHPTGVDK
jgi:hypothetical protein